MRRLVLVAALAIGGIAIWASLAHLQEDPWWHPINAYGQSNGVSYGYNLPTLANTGSAPADGLLAVQLIDPLAGAADERPRFYVYDRSVTGWREFLYQRVSMPDGAGGTWSAVAPTVPTLDGNDTWYGFAINPTNSTTHTGANNQVIPFGIGGITAHANATEWAIAIGNGYDQDIRIDGDGRIGATGDLRFWADASATWVFQVAGDGVYHQQVAFAALPASANGALVWCTNCDQVSSPCASTPGPGTFAFRVNGAWECPF